MQPVDLTSMWSSLSALLMSYVTQFLPTILPFLGLMAGIALIKKLIDGFVKR